MNVWHPEWRPPDVVGAAEAAQLLGVSRQRFSELSKRYGFPPHTLLKCGPVWWPEQIKEWGANR